MSVPSATTSILPSEPESLVAPYLATAKALPALACPQTHPRMTVIASPDRGDAHETPATTPPAQTGASSCDDTYTCSCPLHQAERDYRVKRGVKAPPRQPWQRAA